MPDPIVHFELPADDVERARTFYSKAFGWKVNAIAGMGYTMFHTTPTTGDGMVQRPGNINGGMLARQSFFQNPILTVQVADIDTAAKAIERNGGQVIRPKQPVQGVGFTAYFKDPEGNVMGLVEPAR